MNNKQRKTLESIASKPTPRNLLWSDIESLFKAIGCKIIEGEGSRVSFRYIPEGGDESAAASREDFHRPHPGKEAKPYQVEAARKFLIKIGVLP